MLKKTDRLTKKAFDTYFKSGRRLHGKYMQLIYTPLEQFHGAAVVGKKVSKKAVLRNQYRRRLYNALYQLKIEQELTGVFICITKPTVASATYSELKLELAELISRVVKTRVE